MLMDGLKYWLPRIFIISFALSLVVPAPDFVSEMGEGAFTLWAFRLAWVVGLPLVFCTCLLMVRLIQKYLPAKRKPT